MSPFASRGKSKALNKNLVKLIGDKKFEDIDINLAIISADYNIKKHQEYLNPMQNKHTCQNLLFFQDGVHILPMR